MISLATSLQPLKDRFNGHKDKPRFLALLSPTCPGCLSGARAVQKSVVEDFPQTDISVNIVWINMLPADPKGDVDTLAQIVDGYSVQHFHDPERRVGGAIARSLGWEGKVAWDIYLFYKDGAEWAEDPPPPAYWVHQLWVHELGGHRVDPAHYRCGDDLLMELHEIMSLPEISA